jgi:hypothetical protein
MKGAEMPLQPEKFQESASFRPHGEDRGQRRRVPNQGGRRGVRVLRLLCLLAMGSMLAACGRCGDFLGQSQIGACHSDPPQQQ